MSSRTFYSGLAVVLVVIAVASSHWIRVNATEVRPSDSPSERTIAAAVSTIAQSSLPKATYTPQPSKTPSPTSTPERSSTATFTPLPTYDPDGDNAGFQIVPRTEPTPFDWPLCRDVVQTPVIEEDTICLGSEEG